MYEHLKKEELIREILELKKENSILKERLKIIDKDKNGYIEEKNNIVLSELEKIQVFMNLFQR